MPAGIINTGSHPKALWPGVHAFWGQIYDEHPKEYPDLYDLDSSTMPYVEDVQITGLGLAQLKPELSAGFYDSEIQGPITRYTHLAYAAGYQVSYEERRDNQYEVIAMRRAKANAFSMNQTIEVVAAAYYNGAFTTSLTSDGVSLINTAHVQTTGGTFSNALFPAADLSESTLEDIAIQIMGVQTDRGLNIALMPTSLHIARNEWFNATRILKSVLQNDTSINAVNALRATNAFPKGAVINHYFTSAHAWFVRTNCPNGMNFYWREQPSFAQDNDFDTKNAKALAYMRFSCGCTDPRSIFGSNGP